MTNRYQPRGIEAEFEPGSNGRVLRNELGIMRVRDMQLAESQALRLAQKSAINTFTEDQRFTADDVRSLHRLWLGPIYPWAGELPPLDFSPLDGRGKLHYVAGIHAAMGRDYRKLIGLFERVIARTWKGASSNDR